MDEKKSKLIRYYSAAGALLAISGGAHAVITPGTFTGDAILNSNGDLVFIDMDRDGTPDFVGVAYSGSFYGYFFIKEFLLFSYQSGNLIELDSYTSYLVKKFNLNDKIGPLSYADYYGIISYYSEGEIPTAPAAPFNNADDEGYMGVSMLTSSGINYGWIQVAISPTGEEVEFISGALENTPNTPIYAGNSIPVPLLPIASAAGLGIIGLMAALKKRKKITA